MPKTSLIRKAPALFRAMLVSLAIPALGIVALAGTTLPGFASPAHRPHHRIHRQARVPYYTPPYWSDEFYGGVPLGYLGSPTYGRARYY